MKLARFVLLTSSFLLAFAVTFATPALDAQALPTAQRGAEIVAFGGYTLTHPDFGLPSHNGYTFGADFTIFPHLFVDPSVEVRYDHASNPTVTEHAILIGPRLQKDYGRFHPYVDFLGGIGTIDYHPPPSTDPTDKGESGRDYSIGVGVDFDLFHNFSAKVDYQEQLWNLGKNPSLQPVGNYTLSPTMLTFGVSYHFPFAGLRKQRFLY